MPLTLAINLLHAPPQLTGTGYYALYLAEALLALPQEPRLIGYCTPENASSFAIAHPRFEQRVWGGAGQRLPRRRLEEWMKLHRDVERARPDVFLGPSNFLPPVRPRGVPLVVTIHDTTFHSHPGALPLPRRLYWHGWTWRTVRVANEILTVSEAAKQDIVHYLGVPPKRVTVTYNGVGETFFLGRDPQGFAERQRRLRQRLPQLPRRYISFVGTLTKHKNVPALIEALAHARRHPGCEDIALVLAGKRGYGYLDIQNAIIRHGVGPAVQELGYLEEEFLPPLMEGARAHVLPSLTEGFGLPIVEAMACGTPVVTINQGATAEVGGEAALLAPPGDTRALGEALARVWSDDALARTLREKGLIRAERFTWAETARRTYEVFERVAASSVARSSRP